MSVKLLAPDLRRILDNLSRRLDILERRVSPTAPPAAPPIPTTHTHDGTGADSTAVAGASVTTPPTASGDWSTSIGDSASAQGEDAVALGHGASAFYDNSVAIGSGSNCTAANQVQLGSDTYFGGIGDTVRVVQSCPNTPISSGDLVTSQLSFYLDESGNNLVAKVKYSSGTVKTGTVALT